MTVLGALFQRLQAMMEGQQQQQHDPTMNQASSDAPTTGTPVIQQEQAALSTSHSPPAPLPSPQAPSPAEAMTTTTTLQPEHTTRSPPAPLPSPQAPSPAEAMTTTTSTSVQQKETEKTEQSVPAKLSTDNETTTSSAEIGGSPSSKGGLGTDLEEDQEMNPIPRRKKRPAGKTLIRRIPRTNLVTAPPAAASSSQQKKSSSTTTKVVPIKKKSISTNKAGGLLSGSNEVFHGPPDEPLDGGWPIGWTKKVYERKGGILKGKHDRYWYTPVEKYKLRSMVEVKRFIQALEMTQGDEHAALSKIRGR